MLVFFAHKQELTRLGGPSTVVDSSLGVWAAEEIEAKRVGKEASLRPLSRTVAVATAGKMGAKWDFSPAVAADALLPPRLLGVLLSLQLSRLRRVFLAFGEV